MSLNYLVFFHELVIYIRFGSLTFAYKMLILYKQNGMEIVCFQLHLTNFNSVTLIHTSQFPSDGVRILMSSRDADIDVIRRLLVDDYKNVEREERRMEGGRLSMCV